MSYAHDVSDAMFRRTASASLCLIFASCVMIQQNATFLGVVSECVGVNVPLDT